MTGIILLLLTVPFIIISHYVAVYPHEFTHSFLAWGLGYKSNPFNIQYGGTGLSNLLLITGVDENVNYEAVSQSNPHHAALIAFAGPAMNVLLFLVSYWLLQKKQIHDRSYLYYFLIWFNVMNIANVFDYVPIRTFTPLNWNTDMSNVERGLNISP
ncbi:MAG: site-2 protease family protein, partial [Candidatus Binataceae bacterium]